MKQTRKSKGFTQEERDAMKEHLQELKREKSRGANQADGESDVLAKLAELPQPDRAMGERLHAIIKATAPHLTPRTWYGMPAYAKDGNVVCFKARRSSRRDMQRSASATKRASTMAPCGRPLSRCGN